MLERRREPEVMDDPLIDAVEHERALSSLQLLNRVSHSVQIVLAPIIKLAREMNRPLRVLDVASGAGDIPVELSRAAKEQGVSITAHGVDKSETAVHHAQVYATERQSSATFSTSDIFQEELPSGFDVVTCSLFLHHLDPEKAIELIQKMAKAAGQLLLINDLERSRSGLLLAYAATRVFSRSRVVHIDGPRSVRGAYTGPEAGYLARKAGLSGLQVSRHWPCRFLLQWRRDATGG